MKKELYDAYATYCEIIQKGKPVDQLTNEELRQYMLIDRDEKFKKIFEKAGDKVLPLTTIVPQYNALIDQEIAKQKEATMMDDVKTMPNPETLRPQCALSFYSWWKCL